jgi:excisionase family DNA binding protein
MDIPIAAQAALSLVDAAKAASCSKPAIYRAIKRGELRAKKRGRRTLVLYSDLVSWLNALPDASLKADVTFTGEGI